MRRLPLLLSFILLLSCLTPGIFSGCRKSDHMDQPGSPVPPDLSTKVKVSVNGFITDASNKAADDAIVTVGNKTAITNEYGYFEINDVMVVAEAAIVKVIRQGYFTSTRTFIAREGKKESIHIKMLSLNPQPSIASNTANTITLTNGLSISFPADAFVNAATHTTYNGNVKVSAQWLDPSSPDISLTMPGDLRGINTDGNVQLLTTYGMAAVTLTSDSNDPLQMAPGKKATISFPIPAAFQSLAPSTIPLWYFDENTGLWKEEGSAVKINGKYVGDVSHFSFWNCDLPGNAVMLDVTVTDAGGMPVSNALLKITDQSNPANFRYGRTDATGSSRGLVPANAVLKLDVLSDVYCPSIFYSTSFTTGNTNISLPVTTPSVSAHIAGRVTDCGNNPVNGGNMYVQKGQRIYWCPISSSGTYHISLIPCGGSESISIVAEDAVHQQQNLPLTFTINTGNNNLPDIKACGISTMPYFDYSINGTSYHHTYPDTIYIYAAPAPPPVPGFSILVKSNPNSTQTVAGIAIDTAGITTGSVQNLRGFSSIHLPQLNIPNPVNVSITEFGLPGRFISGNFTGTLVSATAPNTSYNISCSFRVKRRW